MVPYHQELCMYIHIQTSGAFSINFLKPRVTVRQKFNKFIDNDYSIHVSSADNSDRFSDWSVDSNTSYKPINNRTLRFLLWIYNFLFLVVSCSLKQLFRFLSADTLDLVVLRTSATNGNMSLWGLGEVCQMYVSGLNPEWLGSTGWGLLPPGEVTLFKNLAFTLKLRQNNKNFTQGSQSAKHDSFRPVVFLKASNPVAYPGTFFGWGGGRGVFNKFSWGYRAERTGICSPLVRGSAQFAKERNPYSY
jgi:hypothetical protein